MVLQKMTDNLLQNETKVYYKMRPGLKCDSFFTNCESYYKIYQFYYKMRQLFQNATFTAKCVGTNRLKEH